MDKCNKKKNRFLIFLIGIILMLCLSLSIIYFDLKYFEDNFFNNENPTGENDKLNSIYDITDDYIQKYLATFNMLFAGKTYNEFTDDDISILTAYELLMYSPKSKEEVELFVRQHFNKDNFSIKPKVYHSNLDNFEIKFINNKYETTLGGHGSVNFVSHFQSMNINNDDVVVIYSYDFLTSMLPEEYDNLGMTKIYLKYNNGYLNILKSEYIPKE